VRAAIKQLALNYRGQALPPITVSVGIAEAPLHGESTQDLIRAADNALYAAKAKGRDRVIIAADPAPAVSADAREPLDTAHDHAAS